MQVFGLPRHITRRAALASRLCASSPAPRRPGATPLNAGVVAANSDGPSRCFSFCPGRRPAMSSPRLTRSSPVGGEDVDGVPQDCAAAQRQILFHRFAAQPNAPAGRRDRCGATAHPRTFGRNILPEGGAARLDLWSETGASTGDGRGLNLRDVMSALCYIRRKLAENGIQDSFTATTSRCSR